MSGTSQDVAILNDLGSARIERRERTNAAGDKAVRTTISISSEPVLHDFNSLRLGAGPSKAIAELLRRLMSTFAGRVSPATEDKRMRAATALAIGYASAVSRYSGGRSGTKPPNKDGQGRRHFDSGRFAEGIVAMENKQEEAWTINVPANRLDPKTFGGGESALVRYWQMLTTDIPEFLGGQALLKHAEIRTAIETATAEAIYVVKRDATAKLSAGRWQLARAIAKDAMRILTI